MYSKHFSTHTSLTVRVLSTLKADTFCSVADFFHGNGTADEIRRKNRGYEVSVKWLEFMSAQDNKIQ